MDNKHFALGIEYDGRLFSGWQTQKSPNVRTVQEELELALSRVAVQNIRLTCAGRTDKGVHASAQVVHFSTDAQRSINAWLRGGNSFVSKDISILWAKEVTDEFHARFSATARHYRYIIYNSPIRPAILSGFVTPYFSPLDEFAMHEGSQLLLGEQDFTSYRGVACQSKTAMRNVKSVSVKRYGDYIIVDIIANAFLLHMVRNIVGVLLEIGLKKKPPRWCAEVLAAKDRGCAGVTAPPDGLYLVEVHYPKIFNLPSSTPGPAFIRPYFD